MKGEVVVIPFPFSDLSGSKRRPALVTADRGGNDVVLCQITSKAKQDIWAVALGAKDLEQGRLPVNSNIRPNKIFTADKRTILYSIGRIKAETYKEVVTNIIKLIS